jgi:hypothetical protein
VRRLLFAPGKRAALAKTVVECSSRPNGGDFVPTRERR